MSSLDGVDVLALGVVGSWIPSGSRHHPVLGVGSGMVSPIRLGWAVVRRPNKNTKAVPRPPSIHTPLAASANWPTPIRPHNVQHLFVFLGGVVECSREEVCDDTLLPYI